MHICLATILSIAILLGDSIKLQAAITGPVPRNSDGSESQVCPVCCQQGPAGTPGIPGLPGSQGLYGPAGSKGDAGEPGEKGEMGPIGAVGERGAQGNPGPKGGEGIGLPGMRGSQGPPGLVGPTGEAGVKGQKGEPAETPGNPAHPVAFSVRRRSSTDTSSSDNTHLAFEETETLLPGTSFDLSTGTFTCNVPGTYVFMFSVLKHSSSSYIRVHLKKNNEFIVSGHGNDSGKYEQVSGSAVLVLQQGDTVYLTMHGKAHSGSVYHYTSFNGFLLYAE
ncbi:complement C1q tumor necrosis factor-related protein 2-like [Acanthaster planci]|uniref:Complement C1q tumor necrosis factor-related protein 2-like n=1 Tax=Acanthaster planci TaxID=133434 RepID=A0A8B7ZLX4_ACAPL|nr:complement C1q tumor necrosis factor-related protein 2-like [Acanthaster planci]